MHFRSRHLYYVLAISIIALAVWAVSRVVLCWGDYGVPGLLLCHIHLVTYFGVLAGVALLVLFGIELGKMGLRGDPDNSRPTLRSAYLGFKSLERSDKRHASASGLMLIVLFAVMVYLVFFSPIRF